jgi:ParB family transcriptional regulator, chromosome partitioning protein
MAEPRRGLGRGLSALLGDPASGPASAGEAQQSLAVERLRPNPDQPRRRFGEEELAELAASIREHGVLQPILVRPTRDGDGADYQIVAGERRWRAAQQAGLRTVPVLIRALDDAEVAEIAIVENVQRSDLSALEEAQGYRALLDRFGRTQDTVAKAVGKSRSHVANALRLLSLPDSVQDHLTAGRLTAGHARAIAAAPDPQGLADAIVKGDLTVREAEALARKSQPSKTKVARLARSRTPEKDPDTSALEQDLSESLGAQVEIIDRDGAGELRIHYGSLEELDTLCQRLTRPA